MSDTTQLTIIFALLEGEMSVGEIAVFISGPEAGTGIAKTIGVQLQNDDLWEVELAPWALTTFNLGGAAIFLQPVGNADAAGLLNNRILAVWPYMHNCAPQEALRGAIFLRGA